MAQEEPTRLVVTVKAYPQPSRSYGETVCVAGVRIDKEQPSWIRLYPVSFRDLPFARRFTKYQIVDLLAAKTSADGRPESRRPNLDSLQLAEKIPSAGNWRDRWRYIGPLAGAVTACELMRAQDDHGAPSLGLVKPHVEELIVEPNDDFTADKRRLVEMAAAPDLFGTPEHSPLEAAPYRLRYRYRCESTGCRGHNQSIIDWEAGQAARRWLKEGYSGDTLVSTLREKWLDEMCGPAKDTYFFLGNQATRPKSFLVLGVFWPPAGSRPRATLF